MKMVIILAVCLALSAASASASALQMPWLGMQMPWLGMQMPVMGADYLAQAQCSPVAAPHCGQMMWQPRCQAMCGVAHSVAQQLQMMQLQLQLQGLAAASSLYGPAALMQQLLPVAQALSPLAMVMAQGGLYQQPGGYCTTTPCAAIPPFY